MIYLASPYTHPDPAIQEERFRAVCAYAATMMRQGLRVFSPIAHTHHIALCGLPGGWEFWEAYDRDMIARCDEVAVLCLPGWEESTGVRAEIAIAAELGLPVRYLDPEGVPEKIPHEFA